MKLEYTKELIVGVLPSIVYLIVASGVVEDIVTMAKAVYVPPEGLNVGVAQTLGSVVFLLHVVRMPSNKIPNNDMISIRLSISSPLYTVFICKTYSAKKNQT